MADGTKIEWTDATWNPIVGCSVLSPGCTNCYAMKLAGTRLRHTPSRKGLTEPSKAGPVWNGKVRLIEAWLGQPLAWRRPRRIFVCAHGDLFHEAVPDEWIDRVFAVMALCPQHTFQVLTKRSDRMLHCLRNTATVRGGVLSAAWNMLGHHPKYDHHGVMERPFPLPNVWLGVSAERQQEADARIPDLLATPAAKRFVSLEPLLGPIDLTAIKQTVAPGFFGDPLHWYHRGRCHEDEGVEYPTISWVIAGGESGPNARPMHPDWARSLRDQCQDAGVAFFMKQMTKKAPIPGDLMIREFPT